MQSISRLLALLVSGVIAPTPLPAQDLEELARRALSKIEGETRVPGLREAVEVIRDRWGVPHIYARNMDDLFFAQGYVQAQDRLWQMEMWRRYNAGRLAEVMGPAAVAHDRLLRLIQYQGPWDDEEFRVYHPEGRRIFSAFVAGVNAFIAERGTNLPVEFQLTGIRPEPWTERDAVLRVPIRSLTSARAELAFALEVARLGPEEANRRAEPDPWIDLTVPTGLDLSIISPAVIAALDGTLPTVPFPRPPLLPRYRHLAGAMASSDFGSVEGSPGSNNWAVSGRHTASGRVLLANDPHRDVTNPSLRYLVHLSAPGWDAIGATEPAIPGIAIGHNGRVAWGLTIVGTDYDDVFVEAINPANRNQAKWEGEWYPLRVVVDTIRILGAAPRVVERKYSRHGPIFHEDTVHHRAYALHSTLQERGTAEYLAALRLNQQSITPNCRNFLEQQRYYYAPAENMVCGDVEGNIAWQASGLTPRRVGGWYGRLPVPGTGQYRWGGFRDDLPYEYNPERGWTATANNNVLPEGYHPPLFFRKAPYPRADRLNQIFAAPERLTVQDFQAYQNDDLWPYVEAEKSLLRGWEAADPEVEWARTQLLAWDGRYRRSAIAPSLHSHWLRYLDVRVFRPTGWTARGGAGSAPLRIALDEGGPERQAMARVGLEKAVDELRRTLGPDRSQWHWGRLHRSTFPHWLVSAFDLPAVERNGGAGTIAATGATFREIIDLGDLDNSRVSHTPGQSAQPLSPFYGNLLEAWGKQEFFPLTYSRGAVEAVAAKRLTLRPGR